MDKKELLQKAFLGECIPGLLHNIGNPLGAMLGFVNILREEVTWLRHDMDSYGEHEVRERVQEALGKLVDLFDFAARSEQSMRKAVETMVLKCNHDAEMTALEFDLNELIRIEADVLMTNAFFKHKITKRFEYGKGPLQVNGVWRTYAQPVGSMLFRYTLALAATNGPQLGVRTERVDDHARIIIKANTILGQTDLTPLGEIMPALTLQECSEVIGTQGSVSYAISDPDASSITFDFPVLP